MIIYYHFPNKSSVLLVNIKGMEILPVVMPFGIMPIQSMLPNNLGSFFFFDFDFTSAP